MSWFVRLGVLLTIHWFMVVASCGDMLLQGSLYTETDCVCRTGDTQELRIEWVGDRRVDRTKDQGLSSQLLANNSSDNFYKLF